MRKEWPCKGFLVNKLTIVGGQIVPEILGPEPVPELSQVILVYTPCEHQHSAIAP